MRAARVVGALALLAAAVMWSLQDAGPEVIVYTPLDRAFSEPILKRFERETGIHVRAKYDAESTKTVGLATAILAESKSRPRCDLFWNNEILWTLRMQDAGLLDNYRPKDALSFPQEYRSAQDHWFGFAARARVLLVNTELVPDESMPDSIYDLLDPKWKGQIGIAKPLFSTSASHAMCLFEALGDEAAKSFFLDLRANEVQVLSGNKQVAEDVSAGKIAFGLTDTDDAVIELEAGFPVKIVYPDSQAGQLGTLFIPNTLALQKAGPNNAHARRLMDYLLTAETETMLANGESAQIPLHLDVQMDLRVESPKTIQPMKVDYAKAAKRWDDVATFLKQNFASAQ